MAFFWDGGGIEGGTLEVYEHRLRRSSATLAATTLLPTSRTPQQKGFELCINFLGPLFNIWTIPEIRGPNTDPKTVEIQYKDNHKKDPQFVELVI